MKNLRIIKVTIGSLVIMSVILVAQGCSNINNEVKPDGVKIKSSSLKVKPLNIDWGIMGWTGDIPEACKEVCLVAGQHMYVGNVTAGLQDGDLYVTYSITEPDIYLTEVHLDIFNGLVQFDTDGKLSNGGAILGKFEYQMEWDESAMLTSHTIKVPKVYVDAMDDDCFFIVSHAVLSNGETAYGGLCDQSDYGVSLDNAKQFPGSNWSVYFEFCKDECQELIDYTYAWEDLTNFGNDADYNDMVFMSDIIKSDSELKITFLATARGASFDHKFKIKIPKLGIDNFFGEESFVEDGDYYYITIFESTKEALPPEEMEPFWFSANTYVRDNFCTDFAYAELVFTLNNQFVYDYSKPYEPFITVYPSGVAGDGDNYDLYIYEVSGRDTWFNGEDEFPNGIIIPRDWNWPLEQVNIVNPYPDFSSLTEGWTDNWADNLVDETLVFDKENCN